MSPADLLAAARGLLPPLEGGREDLLLPLYQGIALVTLRVAVEWACLPRLRTFLKSRSHGAARGAEARARDVIEQAFCAAVIAPLSIWGWWVMLNHNGPCTPASPAGCLVGWPGHPVTGQFRWWWLTVGGMYCGEIIGTLLGGVGFKLSREMMVHHAVTMALMLYGYFGGLHRYGQMATTVLDSSNAFLHAAKALHSSGLPELATAKDVFFKLFAAVFLVVRVLLPPFSMIVPGLVYGRVLPTPTYMITNGLMLVIYSLQLIWFRKILCIAGGASDRRVAEYAPTPGGTPLASPRPSKTE